MKEYKDIKENFGKNGIIEVILKDPKDYTDWICK